MKEKSSRIRSLSERQSAVRAVVEKGYATWSVAPQYGMDTKDLYYWVAMFHKYGASGLLPERRRYSSAMKLHIMEAMENQHLSVAATAVRFRVSLGSIKAWKKRYKIYGTAGFRDDKSMNKKQQLKTNISTTDSSEVKRLKEENLRLRAENAYLKKLEALVQARKNSVRAKK